MKHAAADLAAEHYHELLIVLLAESSQYTVNAMIHKERELFKGRLLSNGPAAELVLCYWLYC